MATVTSMTAERILELMQEQVIDGSVAGNGHLLLETQGGEIKDAGVVTKSPGAAWTSAANYNEGDIVGYAGQLWRALAVSTNKPPSLFTSLWERVAGTDSTDWIERDSAFTGDRLAEGWDVTVKTGTSSAGHTITAGEFETGIRALSINLSASSSQSVFQKEENIMKTGEVVLVSVRARLVAAAAGARLHAQLWQNDETGNPKFGATGLTSSDAAEAPKALSTTWATYHFTLTAQGAKPRAVVNILASTDAAGAATVLIDRVEFSRASDSDIGRTSSFYGTKDQCPPGELVMDGSTFSAAVYPKLAQRLGGTTLPNLSDKFPIGASGTRPAGSTGGSFTKTLAVANLPAHHHDIDVREASTAGGAAPMAGSVSGTADTRITGDTGSGTPVDITPPYMALWYTIRAA